jgi:hypothetical protein
MGVGILAATCFLLGRDRLASAHDPYFRNSPFTTLCGRAESTAVDTLHVPSPDTVPMPLVRLYTLFLGHRQRPVVIGDGRLPFGVFGFPLCGRDVYVAFFGNGTRHHSYSRADSSAGTRVPPHYRGHIDRVVYSELALPADNGFDIGMKKMRGLSIFKI